VSEAKQSRAGDGLLRFARNDGLYVRRYKVKHATELPQSNRLHKQKPTAKVEAQLGDIYR
jgi:hypothetical protein